MPERRARVSWEEAVQSGARRIRRDGIAALNLDDVRRDLGALPGAVRYWFNDETDLLISIMQVRQRWFADEADARTAALPSHADKLKALLDLSVADHDMTYWIELWKLGRHDEKARRARRELTRLYRDLFARVVRAGQRAGEFAPVPADPAALVLVALIAGISVEGTVGGDQALDDIHSTLVRTAERLLATDLGSDRAIDAE